MDFDKIFSALKEIIESLRLRYMFYSVSIALFFSDYLGLIDSKSVFENENHKILFYGFVLVVFIINEIFPAIKNASLFVFDYIKKSKQEKQEKNIKEKSLILNRRRAKENLKFLNLDELLFLAINFSSDFRKDLDGIIPDSFIMALNNIIIADNLCKYKILISEFENTSSSGVTYRFCDYVLDDIYDFKLLIIISSYRFRNNRSHVFSTEPALNLLVECISDELGRNEKLKADVEAALKSKEERLKRERERSKKN